mmetsp:Transcript_18632/g.33671  ORF Transcript_18632/g.33671 Transcript_18632/m.33671 type:complete len:565 (+) Transcript_18632:147-1841(+)
MGGCCPSDRNLVYPAPARTVKITSLGKSQVRLQQIRDSYDFIKVIGFGKFGVVREAVELNSNGKNFSVAVKSIPKKKLRGDMSLFMRELQVLQELDHPNIIKLFETFEDEKYFHLVMELCTGGDLLERVVDKGALPEVEAAGIMKKLILAVNHMHSCYISHRDLKPENILYSGDIIKLADFGISNKFGDSEDLEMTSIVGTPHYVAPEVLTRRYGKECDVWSLGVILYVLLSGRMPFDGDDVKEVLEQIMRANFTFSDKIWREVSQDAKHLITKMLTLDPTSRITIKEALEHRWFKNCTKRTTSTVPTKLISKLRKKRASSMLTREAMKIIVKHLPSDNIADLSNYFSYLDPENSGFITAIGLQHALQRSNYFMAYEEIQELISKYDILGQGHIKYTDFLIATLDSKQMLDESNLWIAFKYFDSENTGKLTLSSIHASLIRAGCEVSEEDIDYIKSEFGLNEEDSIGFDSFQRIMVMINSFTPAVSEISSPLEKIFFESSARKLSSDMAKEINSIRKNSVWESYNSRANTIKRIMISPEQDTQEEPVPKGKEAPNIVVRPIIEA